MRDRNYFDRVYIQDRLLFTRISSDDVLEHRNYYCKTSTEAIIALLDIIQDMDSEIKLLKYKSEE